MEATQGMVNVKREKKTRRRLRLSCVECTKRRQKCDRNHPCSLCISRNVPHLCRWENVPVARPPPARPPYLLSSPDPEIDPTIKQLRERIKILEDALAQQSKTPPGPLSPAPVPSTYPASASEDKKSVIGSPSSTASQTTPFPPSPDHDAKCTRRVSIEYPLDDTVYSITSFLAQLSLAHHGEFIGRGSLICALHSLSTKKIRRFLYAHSTDATYLVQEAGDGCLLGSRAQEFDQLLNHIPPEAEADQLIQEFFRHVNWRFGIPEKWFKRTYHQMWNILKCRSQHQGTSLLNPNWVCLFFSILAISPWISSSDHPAELNSHELYFKCAMSARCIAESVYLEEPSSSIMVSAADGTVLSCLAIPLLCSYLAERGHASEAWKLVGKAVSGAIAIGMHQDPGWPYWQVMSEEEKLLRRRAWWGLFVWDRLYSYVLGRPHFLRKDFADVEYPLDKSLGSRDPISIGQIALIKLADIVGEAIDKTFIIDYPDCPVFFDLDEKFKKWEEKLPQEYAAVNLSDASLDTAESSESLLVTRLSYLLRTWYLLSRVKLHIACTTGQGRIAGPPHLVVESRERCFLAATELIRLQCDILELSTAPETSNKHVKHFNAGNSWYFEGCFSLLEASVTIMTIMTHRPFSEKATEVDALLDRSHYVFKRVASHERGRRGTIARMSLEVLGILRHQSIPPDLGLGFRRELRKALSPSPLAEVELVEDLEGSESKDGITILDMETGLSHGMQCD